MNPQLCYACHHWWCHNAGDRRNFDYITRYCPTCIATHPKAAL